MQLKYYLPWVISMVLFVTVIVGIAVAISIMALTWIHKLENIQCICSQDFKRDYIKYFLYVYLGINAISYITMIYIILRMKTDSISRPIQEFINIISAVLPIFSLINIIFSIMYIYRLKEIDCKCSEDIRREIYYVINWIYIGMIALSILLAIILAILGVFFISNKNN
jgi:hypothetical protein